MQKQLARFTPVFVAAWIAALCACEHCPLQQGACGEEVGDEEFFLCVQCQSSVVGRVVSFMRVSKRQLAPRRECLLVVRVFYLFVLPVLVCGICLCVGCSCHLCLRMYTGEVGRPFPPRPVFALWSLLFAACLHVVQVHARTFEITRHTSIVQARTQCGIVACSEGWVAMASSSSVVAPETWASSLTQHPNCLDLF